MSTPSNATTDQTPIVAAPTPRYSGKPGDTNSRRYTRFASTKSADITAGRGRKANSVKGAIVDCSELGATIAVPKAKPDLNTGETVRLRWSPDAFIQSQAAPTERVCELDATIVGKRGEDDRSRFYGVRFHQLIDEGVREHARQSRRKISALLALATAVLICYLKAMSFLNASHLFFKFYSLVAGLFFFSRVLIARSYKEPRDRGYLPKVSVIIAAMNEQDCIEATIMHVIRSRYPTELLEVIAIDDGSTDGTWAAMQDVKRRFPNVQTIRFEKNKGKRHGMAAGARAATGDILVYVDSDSFVEPEALYRIVQGFHDKTVGAVAGHTLVLLEKDNPFSKMESVRYYISHRVLKSAESIYGAVTCCPGAFSAYRRESVMKVLDAWLGQRFLGVQATFGDDRSLTNYILKTQKVIFHNGARATTKVPDNWRKYFKQQLRWKKSWCRETFIASRLMLQKHPVAALSYYAGVFLTILSPIVILRSLIYMPVVAATNPGLYLGGLLLSYLLLGLMCCYYTETPYWYHGINFAMLYLSVLCWQNYYALFTINETSWGTR